jgi:plasmid stabilization system protein ParE
MYSVQITDLAERDLASNLYYITDVLKNPLAANRLLLAFEVKKKLLEDMPYISPLVHDGYLAQKGVRSVSVKNYTLFYVIHEEFSKIFIIRFLYGRRDWKTLLKNNV